jgi:conjugal transfer pilus assembly protein TraW
MGMAWQRMHHIGVGLVCVTGLVMGASVVRGADVSAVGAEALERAQAVKQQADLSRHQRLETQGTPGGSAGIKRREGLYYFVSWSIPEPELKGYMREAFHLGATVVFRGLLDDDMRKTVERTKALAVELDKEAPHTVLDPVIFRQFGVTAVPALAVAKDQQALIVEGATSLRHLLRLLSRADGRVTPLLEWAEDKSRSWDRGGPVMVNRPVMPALTGIRKVPSTLTKYPIQERDLQEAIKERLRHTDTARLRRELGMKVKDRLKEGPHLTLPKATETRVFSVDLTQKFANDIPNHDGSAILVKAGTEVNPLAYVSYRHRLVVIDGRDKAQVHFAQEQVQKFGAAAVKVLLTDGDYEEVAKVVHDRVYWLQPDLLTRFQLAHVPSVVTQNGPLLQVEERRIE